MLLFSIGLLFCAFACSALVTPGGGSDDIAASFFVAVLSYGIYWLILLVTGYAHRLVPTIAAIMACGSILTIVNSFAIAVLSPILVESTVATIAWLITIWTIPVKGSIIARAIEQHWFMGIALAMSIFVLQYVVYFNIITPVTG